MNAIESHIERIPLNLKYSFADCFDMYFTGVDNAGITSSFINQKVFRKNVPMNNLRTLTNNSKLFTDISVYKKRGNKYLL